jgi:hypothetical protein
MTAEVMLMGGLQVPHPPVPGALRSGGRAAVRKTGEWVEPLLRLKSWGSMRLGWRVLDRSMSEVSVL